MNRDLCIMACLFCKDDTFQRWIWNEIVPMLGTRVDTSKLRGEAGAKAIILRTCAIKSRNELDTNPDAAKRFHKFIREPFLAWKERL